MKIILILFILTIQSSYLKNSESPAVGNLADTVQFYADSKGAWRVKTFATDQDVHPWSLGPPPPADLVTLADRNTEKNYGDVIARRYVIVSETGIEGLRDGLKAQGLDDHLEISKSGLVFWTPAGTNYRSKSSPQQ